MVKMIELRELGGLSSSVQLTMVIVFFGESLLIWVQEDIVKSYLDREVLGKRGFDKLLHRVGGGINNPRKYTKRAYLWFQVGKDLFEEDIHIKWVSICEYK